MLSLFVFLKIVYCYLDNNKLNPSRFVLFLNTYSNNTHF